MNYLLKRVHLCFTSWAEPPAHIPLHAFLMSPILIMWHRSFRITGLTPWRYVPGPSPSYSSQLKD
ncbi:protein YnhH [Klebsiella sp. RIT-PI-d]|uniref:protein YnhH n=1 Tax=Klebsiella sp. RIT-PI-d TaxID=1681196 RepID=UPI00403F3E7C